jgi:hypothetical protein
MPDWSPSRNAKCRGMHGKLLIHVRSASKQEPAETRTARVGDGWEKIKCWVPA